MNGSAKLSVIEITEDKNSAKETITAHQNFEKSITAIGI